MSRAFDRWRRASMAIAAGSFALALASPAAAEIIYVPDQYPTLEEAVLYALEHDVIILREGVHTASNSENWDWPSQMTIRGDPDAPLHSVALQPPTGSPGRVLHLDGASSPPDRIVLDRLWIRNGRSSEGGGAVYANNAWVDIRNCKFSNNSSSGSQKRGGAIFSNQAYVTAVDTVFVSNWAEAFGADGGAVYLVGHSLFWGTRPHLFERCHFSQNWADQSGGAIRINSARVVIAQSTFEANEVHPWAGSNSPIVGGAINAVSGSRVSIDRCRFLENVAYDRGGALGSESGRMTVSNSLFWHNRTDTQEGSVFYGGDEAELVNCTMVWNQAGDGTNLAVNSPWTDLCRSINNQFRYNSGDDLAGFFEFARCDDAEFVDPGDVNTVGDYRLLAGSPGIDAGATSLYHGGPLDLADEARCVDDPAAGTIAGPVIDCGAYEFQPDDPCPADADGSGGVDFNDLLRLLADWGPCPT